MLRTCLALACVATLLTILATPAVAQDEIRVGIIGTDTSHVIAFTQILNDPNHAKHVPGAKVVAAFKGGSDDLESSYSRVDKYAEQLQNEFGVKIVETIPELCSMVDAVLLESVDGRPHLEQARPVFEAGKIMFIDKPVAGSLKDAIEIYRLSKEHNVPCFSSSSYRYYESLTSLLAQDYGELKGVISYGPAHLEPTHPDLFWYGVHATEALFTAMGAGCKSVVRTSTPDTDVVTGVWEGDRVGTLRGLRNQATPHQVILFGTKSVLIQEDSGDYAPLVAKIVEFFKTGVAPVSPRETIEIFAFMEAADESKRRDGVPVSIDEVLEMASDGKPLPY